MDKKIYIAPSTEPAKDIDELIAYTKNIENYADFLHCDVMDGIFVEKKKLTSDIISVVNSKSTIPLDVHLMIKNPKKEIEKYINSGANIVTVHYESFKSKKHLISCLKRIKKQGALCGVSINPSTDVELIFDILNFIDLVLIMGVVPGKSGQKMIGGTVLKVATLNAIKKQYNINFIIEVDGGVNNINCHDLIDAGANCLVSGNYVFSSENKQQAIQSLRV